MDKLHKKFQALDDTHQQLVMQYIDHLLSLKKTTATGNMKSYKQKILQVSTWKDEDIQLFRENSKFWSQWKISDF